MALNGTARGTAIYNQIAMGDNFGKLSIAEKNALKTQLIAIFGSGDLTYLLANTVVNPGTMNSPSGQPVATTGSAVAQTGATTAPSLIGGAGTIS